MVGSLREGSNSFYEVRYGLKGVGYHVVVLGGRQELLLGWELLSLFPYRNVCSYQPYASLKQHCLCSGSAQAKLSFGSCLPTQVCSL